MYVSIDLDNMRFLHKHPDLHVVCNLVAIEAPHLAVCVTSCNDAAFLRDYTDMELRMLYRNTAGGDHMGDGLQAAVFALVQQLPVCDVNGWEVDRQAASIPVGNSEPYRYVKGATVPSKQGAGLFPAASAAGVPLQRPAHPTPTPVPPRAPARRTAQVTPVTAPQRGSVRDTVWEVADRMWEAAGKPQQLTTVLALRKRVMDKLESKYGIKRSTASNTLAQWQKVRLV